MFTDRTDAGRQLADILTKRRLAVDLVVAIPRGGLPVGRVVADRLGVPLDIVAARKIGAPSNPELAIGAVASDGTVWLNDSMIDDLGISTDYLDAQTEREHAVAHEKVERYRTGRPSLDVTGKTVLVVDDGIATGATTIACLRQLKHMGASRVLVGVPVAPPEVFERLGPESDGVICVETPAYFGAVGQFYTNFEQVSDEDAKSFLTESEQ